MDFNRILQEVIAEAKELNIPISDNINKNVTINTRAKKRNGRCSKKNGEFAIEVSHSLKHTDDFNIKKVLAHEILHTCPACMNHGVRWKQYAFIMNSEYDYEISRVSSCESLGISIEMPAKYIIQCSDCKSEFKRHKVSKLVKNVSRYRCQCGGSLKLI